MIPIEIDSSNVDDTSMPSETSSSAIEFNPRTYIGFLMYHISFFIIVTTIGLNIVFGIIVDTFSELREERVSHSYLFDHRCIFILSEFD